MDLVYLHYMQNRILSLIICRSKKSLRGAKGKITEIMNACEQIEKSTGESERLLKNYKNDIKQHIEYTQAVSTIIDHDMYFLLIFVESAG